MSERDIASESGEAWGALPRRFGPYVLLTPLAEGGFGAVYLAKVGGGDVEGLEGVEKICVVKTLQTRYTSDKEYVARFIDEARVVVRLTHRNICPVFDVGKVGEKHYLAMEFVSGVDLRTLADDAQTRGRPLPENAILHLIMEVLDALDYAHRLTDPMTGAELRVVHRDVTPQNILINFEGEPKLIDFGLALSSQRVAEDTQPNIVLGKMAYMAPEHARGDPIDARADLFSVAAIAYELLARERWYEGLSHDDIWRIAGTGHRPKKMDTLDPALARILTKATAQDRDRRYATCAELRDELEGYAYARGLRRGDRDLREILRDVFAPEREQTRVTLSRHSSVPAPLGKPEPTTTFAVAPPSLPEMSTTNPERRRTAPTGPTTAAPRSTSFTAPASKSRAAVIGAGIGAGLAILAGVVVVWAKASAPVVEAPPVEPPPTSTRLVAVPHEEEPTVVEPVVAPVVEPPIAPTPPPPKPPVEPPPPRKKPTPVHAAPPPPPPPAPPKPASGPPEGATVRQKLEWLEQKCPEQACVREARDGNAAIGPSTTVDELKAFKASLDRCVKKCR